MRIQIFSDLHLDVLAIKKISIAPDVDVVAVAGDTCQGALSAFKALRDIVSASIPVVMVMGNHEFYRRIIHEELALALATARDFNVHLLQNSETTINGVRFLGATLWTDYALFGRRTIESALDCARYGLNDHVQIRLDANPGQSFTPEDALSMHNQSRAYLETALSNGFAGPTVVVTHHAPHRRSVFEGFRADLLSAAYVSNLSALIERYSPGLWIHGHVHNSFDYEIGRTRIICNPHGYGDENIDFNPSLVVEL
jgi:Icc-related predicted phosphoesterase